MKLHPTLALVFLLSLFSCKDTQVKIKPERRIWVESIYASSKIEALNQYAHHAEVNGRLLRYAVNEGDTVNSGDLIAVLEGIDPETRLRIAKFQREYALSSANTLKEIEMQIGSAQELALQDSIDFFRQKRLQSKGIGSQQQMENRRLKYEQSKRALLGQKLRLKTLTGEIQAQLKQAEQNVAMAQKQRDAYYIYAVRSGRVYELKAVSGELLSPQQSIALIGDAHKFQVNMEIDERDISRIRVGQEAVVKLDAYPNTFRAQIVHITPRLDLQTQTFHAEAFFKESHPKFYPGLTAESNIILQEKSNVLVLPAAAVQEGDFVETSQGRVPLKIGLRNAQYAEVLSGIDENTEIFLPK